MDAEINAKSHVEAVSDVRDRIIAQKAPTNSTINAAVNTRLGHNTEQAAPLLQQTKNCLIIAGAVGAGLMLLAALSLTGWLYGVWQNRDIRGMP